MALVWAAEATRETEMPMFSAGRWPALKRSVSRKIWPSVIEITLVGMYAETSPGLGLDQRRAVSEPPPFSSLMRAARSSRRLWDGRRRRRVGLAAGRAAQQEGHLAIRPGVLRKVVVHAQGVFDELALGLISTPTSMTSSPIRAAGVRGEVLEGGRLLGAGAGRRWCGPWRPC